MQRQSAQKESQRLRTGVGKPIWRMVRRKKLSKKPEGSLEKVMNQKQGKTNESIALWIQASSAGQPSPTVLFLLVSVFTCPHHRIGHPRAAIISSSLFYIQRFVWHLSHGNRVTWLTTGIF